MSAETSMVITRGRTVGEADIAAFAGFTGDFAPLHIDEEYAKATQFGGRLLHGVSVLAICNGLIVLDGVLDRHLAFLGCDFKVRSPTRPGDTLHVEVVEVAARVESKGEREIATYQCDVFNQREELVLESTWTLMRPIGSSAPDQVGCSPLKPVPGRATRASA